MNINPALVWIILGIILVVTEVLTTTFTLLFFGAGCFIAATAAYLGVESLALQILIAGLFSGVGLFLFRSKLVDAMKTNSSMDSNDLTNDSFQIDVDLPPKASAKSEFRGTSWTVVNSSEKLIKKGDTVYIIKNEGLKLIVTGEK